MSTLTPVSYNLSPSEIAPIRPPSGPSAGPVADLIPLYQKVEKPVAYEIPVGLQVESEDKNIPLHDLILQKAQVFSAQVTKENSRALAKNFVLYFGFSRENWADFCLNFCKDHPEVAKAVVSSLGDIATSLYVLAQSEWLATMKTGDSGDDPSFLEATQFLAPFVQVKVEEKTSVETSYYSLTQDRILSSPHSSDCSFVDKKNGHQLYDLLLSELQHSLGKQQEAYDTFEPGQGLCYSAVQDAEKLASISRISTIRPVLPEQTTIPLLDELQAAKLYNNFIPPQVDPSLVHYSWEQLGEKVKIKLGGARDVPEATTPLVTDDVWTKLKVTAAWEDHSVFRIVDVRVENNINEAPTVLLSGPVFMSVDQEAHFAAAVTDPNPQDQGRHTYTWQTLVGNRVVNETTTSMADVWLAAPLGSNAGDKITVKVIVDDHHTENNTAMALQEVTLTPSRLEAEVKSVTVLDTPVNRYDLTLWLDQSGSRDDLRFSWQHLSSAIVKEGLSQVKEGGSFRIRLMSFGNEQTNTIYQSPWLAKKDKQAISDALKTLYENGASNYTNAPALNKESFWYSLWSVLERPLKNTFTVDPLATSRFVLFSDWEIHDASNFVYVPQLGKIFSQGDGEILAKKWNIDLKEF